MSNFDNAINSVHKITQSVMGTDVTYTYVTDSSTSEIKGVFDNSFVEINGVTTLKPVLKIRLSDLESEPDPGGDTVTINEITYTIMDIQKDSYGAASLILEKT